MMSRVIAELQPKNRPFGVDFLWDPKAALAIAKATGAAFIREVVTGTYESGMGLWSPDAAELYRYPEQIGAQQVRIFVTTRISTETKPPVFHLTLRHFRSTHSGAFSSNAVFGWFLCGHRRESWSTPVYASFRRFEAELPIQLASDHSTLSTRIALLINQAVSTIIAAVFLPSVGKHGYATMFFIFAGCTVVYFITAAFFLPEMKGKTLEEIEGHFRGNVRADVQRLS
jgi:hypothetical protein